MKMLLPEVMMACLLATYITGLEESGQAYEYPEIGSGDDDYDEFDYGSGEPYGSGTPCDCDFDNDYDELNCSSDARFQQAKKCNDGTTVFIGGKCRYHENRLMDFSDFCDGVRSCDDNEDEPRGQIGFKCNVRPFFKLPEMKDRCTMNKELIDRWENAILEPNLTIHSICPNEEDICFINGTATLNISKCFQCLDGTVISADQVCDNKTDCLDLSDECLCLGKPEGVKNFCEAQKMCDEDQIAWGNDTINYTCIEKAEFLKGKEMIWKDCPKCEDSSKHQPDTMQCSPNNIGWMSVKKCDGRPRCSPDAEDECQGCPETPEYCDHFELGIHVCIPINNKSRIKVDNAGEEPYHVCDGLVDCVNSTDEIGCRRIPCHDTDNYSYDILERCDYKLDCANGADERHCPDTFYCEDGTLPGIPRSRLGDGIFDCLFGEDECNYKETSFSSGQNMMKSEVFLVSTWIFALMALVGNAMVIYSCSKDLYVTCQRGTIAANRARVGVCNKILVLNLAIADFLMGVYLLILGIKALEYNGIFCSKWQEWRSSMLCSGIGAVAMLSSQTSVLIMVMMTTYRFYSVRSPFRAERLRARYLVVGVLFFCWLPPLFVAFYPLQEKTMAFAFQPVARLRHFPRFIIEKSDFQLFITGAWLAASNKSAESLGDSSWKNLLSRYDELFPKVESGDGKNLVEKWYGYYSADSVCFPRLFPDVMDSGWEYTTGVITFDFIAFIYILLAYSIMYICTVRRFSSSNNGNAGSAFNSDKVRSREDRVIWRRISRLILTDFICWVPVCITCLVALAGCKINPLMYQISALIFLPVNSAVNPLLYSNIVCRTFERFANKVNHRIKATPGHPSHAIRAASTSSKAHGAVASGLDETRDSRDGLISDNKSVLTGEMDKMKISSLGHEGKPLMGNEAEKKRWEASSSTNSSPSGENKNALSECIAKLGLRRFFSERRVNDITLDERSTLPRRQRPKSRSTTSTGTTFTSCGEV